MPQTYTSGDEVKVTVTVDVDKAIAEGVEFFRLFEENLKGEFKLVLVWCLAKMKEFAPVGDKDFNIEWGGAPTQRQKRSPGADMGNRITKQAGGTLRRDLTVLLEEYAAELWTATFGVPADAPSAKYARFRETGGDIEAKRAPMLVFSPDGKVVVRIKHVHQEATPYAIPALVLAYPRLLEAPRKAWEITAAQRRAG